MRWSPRKVKHTTPDPEAQAERRSLADRLYPGLFAYLYRLSGDWDLAQDLARASFVRLVLRPLPAPPDRRGRLYRIATALACRAVEACGAPAWQRRTRLALRRGKDVARAGRAAAHGAPRGMPDTAFAEGPQSTRWGRPGPLEEGLAGLSFGDRAAMLLCDHHGFGPSEAAVVLKQRPAQVRARLQRGRAALRSAYAAALSAGPDAADGASADPDSRPDGTGDSAENSTALDSAAAILESRPGEHAAIAALLDGGAELSPAAQAEVARHAGLCPACGERLALDARIKTDLARLPDPWPSHRSRETLRAALLHPEITREYKPAANGRRWPALAAVGLLIVGIVAGASFWLIGLAGSSQAARPQSNAPSLAPTFPAAAPSTAVPTPVATRSPAAGLPADAVNWLQANAIPLTTTQPGGSTSDLAPVKDLIGSARIVALANSAGGTHELPEMQQRVMQYLIADAGFRTLAVDTAAPQADLVNDYVNGKQQDAGALMLQLPGELLRTQEMLDTVQWLAALNQSSDSPRIQFRGFDLMQEYSHYPQDAIVEYLKQVDPGAVQRVYGSDQELVSYLEGQRANYAAAGNAPRAAYGRALRSARALLQYDAYTLAPDAAARDLLRTESMLANVTSLLRMSGSGGRIIVWGSAADLGVYAGRHNLGAQLRDRFGKDYVVLDLAFYQGAVSTAVARPGQAPGPIAIQRVASPASGAWEDFLQQAGKPLYLLNLRGVRPPDDAGSGILAAPTPAPPAGSAGLLSRPGSPSSAPAAGALAWLQAPHDMRSIVDAYSQCYPEDYDAPVSLPEAFDGLIFAEETSPATLISQFPGTTTQACPTAPQNLDFSAGTDGWAKGGTAPGAYIIGVHPAAPGAPVTAAGYIRPPRPEPSGSGALMQAFRAGAYRASRLRLTATAMANDTDGEAFLWLKIEGSGGRQLVFAIRQVPNGDPQAQGLVVDVPSAATRISFGIEMQSRGEVWIRDVRLETVGQEVPLSPIGQ